MTAYPAPPTGAIGWLYGGFGRQGYRRVRVGASTTLLTWQQDFPAGLGVLDAATPWTWSVGADGRVQLAGATDELVWLDRLGWSLGFDREGMQSEGSVTTLTARELSPACIPLFARTYEAIDRERERQLVIDRFGRGHGYVFGKVDLWRWQLRMHRTGLAAWRTRWCARGPLMISPNTVAQHRAGTAIAWSPSTPGGYVRGRVLGTEGEPRPIDSIGRMYELTVITANAGVVS